MAMQIQIHHSIDDIPASQWNALLASDYPFMQHQFLAAMEHHGCVGEAFGWLPRHVAIYEDDALIAAMPLYEKHNSYGEFVFDHSWADAYRRAGHPYFPKLVCAVPYTPATGPRLLVATGQEEQLWPMLLEMARQLADAIGASGFHCLFQTPEEHAFTARSALTRHDCQFHWKNRNYRHFDDFLATLKSKKRKNIRQERRRIAAQGITFRVLDGHSATTTDWTHFSHFYQRTFDEKWGMATFNQGFFEEVGRTMPESIVLVLADLDGDCIAGALMYRSSDVLYGRHWGCTLDIDLLHFETCYYQGIDYCIEHGLKHFEPGAQGEYKAARGFVPTLTRSSHYLFDRLFYDAIERFCAQERDAVADYIDEMRRHLPYKESR